MKKALPAADSLADSVATSRRAQRPPRRRRVTEDLPDPDLAAHTKEREKAYTAVHQWNGQPLKPFSIGRESIFFELRAAAGAPRLAAVIQEPIAFLGDAMRILFLCSHDPENWDHLRGQPVAFLRAVEKWAEGDDTWQFAEEPRTKNQKTAPPIPRSEQLHAVRVALSILNDSGTNRAEPAPSDREDCEGE